MVGWVRLKVQGPAGTKVTLRHAEVLDKDGNFYTANLRKAKATLEYTLKGGGLETFEPHFTFFGFRYVAVDGFPGEVTPEALTGIVIHSEMAPRGRIRDLEAPREPAPAQHRLGAEGKFPRRPHRLPAARRAARMDGRRPGLLPHRRLQHGRGRLLHQVAEGRGRRPVPGRGGAPRGAERAARVRGARPRGSGGLGGRGHDHPLGDVPGATGTSASSNRSTTAWRAGSAIRRLARATTTSGTATSTSATGSPSPPRAWEPTTIRARPRART